MVRASSFHSINPEPWFAYSGGIKIVCPAFPADAKGLLKSAIRDDNPVMFLEHKWIYRRDPRAGPRGPGLPRPDRRGRREAGRRRRLHRHVRGDGAPGARGGAGAGGRGDLGGGRRPSDASSHWTRRPSSGRSRRRRGPWCSPSRTGTVGIGAEVASTIAEKAFEHLDAPVVRLAPPNVPVPFSPTLEDAFLPGVDDIVADGEEALGLVR